MIRGIAIAAVVLLTTMPLISLAGKPPSNLGVSDGGLAACPSSPNCVSSDASDRAHQVPPLQLAVAPAQAWDVARELVSQMPRTHIVKETADYIHAECRSSLLGFVDDLELHLRASDGIIAVRSASRLGYSDLGVNRRRVESLRDLLIERSVLSQ